MLPILAVTAIWRSSSGRLSQSFLSAPPGHGLEGIVFVGPRDASRGEVIDLPRWNGEPEFVGLSFPSSLKVL